MNNPTNDHQYVNKCTAQEKRFLLKLDKDFRKFDEQLQKHFMQCKDFLESTSPTPKQIKLIEQFDNAGIRATFYRYYLMDLHHGNVFKKISDDYAEAKKLIAEGNKEIEEIVFPVIETFYNDALINLLNES